MRGIHRRIPFTKASVAKLWCFLWSAPEQTVEETIVTPVVWDAIAPNKTSPKWVAESQRRALIPTIPSLYQRKIKTATIISNEPNWLAPSQWETSLRSNAVSHWLGAKLQSTLEHRWWHMIFFNPLRMCFGKMHFQTQFTWYFFNTWHRSYNVCVCVRACVCVCVDNTTSIGPYPFLD